MAMLHGPWGVREQTLLQRRAHGTGDASHVLPDDPIDIVGDRTDGTVGKTSVDMRPVVTGGRDRCAAVTTGPIQATARIGG